MSLKNGTRFRLLAACLLLTAATLGGTRTGLAGSLMTKNSTGCSLEDEQGSATRDGCTGGGEGCYKCLHSTGGGIFVCWENADGTIGGCGPDGGSGGPYAV